MLKRQRRSKGGKVFFHPLCHLVRGERLFYILLRLKGPFDILRNRIENDLLHHDLMRSSGIYPLFGQSDVLIRVWTPTAVLKAFLDDLEKSAYTSDRNIFLIGEIETWYQRELESKSAFSGMTGEDSVDGIIKNPEGIPGQLQKRGWKDTHGIHFYIFFDGSMAVSEDIFSQIKDKIRDRDKIRKEYKIDRISIYSYYMQDRRGVLLKAEIKDYRKHAKRLAEWARELKPIGGKSHTLLCQTTGNRQGDDLYEARIQIASEEAKKRVHWTKGKQSKDWQSAFANSILETQEFDEAFIKHFEEAVGPKKQREIERQRLEDAREISIRFREIIAEHAVKIGSAYESILMNPRSKPNSGEDWWRFLYEMRKLYKWSAMKNETRIRDFFMTKFVLFEKALREALEPAFPVLQEIRTQKRSVHYERAVLGRIVKQVDKIEATLKVTPAIGAAVDGAHLKAYIASLKTHLTSTKESEELLECIQTMPRPFRKEEVTLGGIRKIMRELADLLQSKDETAFAAQIKGWDGPLERCNALRIDFMHGLEDNYFGSDKWKHLIRHYVAFRLDFPALLASLRGAVGRLKPAAANSSPPA